MFRIIRNAKYYQKNFRYFLNILGFGGLLRFLESRVSGSTLLFKKRVKGHQHPVLLRVPSSDVFTFEKVFVDKEYGFRVNRQPQVIVDAGANIGLASVFFSHQFPGVKIIAIEPEQSNFDLLVQNVAPYPNVIPVQAALWNKDGEISLVDPGLGSWGFMTQTADSPEAGAGDFLHRVRAVTVESILEEYRLPGIDILKVDIEGAEKEVFSDTSSWIAKIDSIIIELHDGMKEGCSSSFYDGTKGFGAEWKQGENVFLSRGDCIVGA
jgi:FkbM family methyltransferase